VTAIAIDGAHVLADRGFRLGTVAIDGATIAAVAFGDDERRALYAGAAEIVDGTGCWLVPGLVDAHTHAYGTLLRGTESALPLELWAFYTIAYGYGLDDDAIAAAMLLHDAECIRSGITGVVDHFPHMAHAHAALAAHERSGMRVLFAAFVQDVSDYDLFAIDVPPELRDIAAVPPVDEPAYEALFADLVASARGGSGRVRVALGPNAPQRCSPAIWALWRRLRERHGVAVHAHALETRAQARIGRQNWPSGGMIAAMDDAGLLDDDLSLAHAVWTTPAERALLAKRGVAVVHNPLSNLMLGSGIMPLDAYLDAGVTVGIGTDGSNGGGRHDLLETMRVALTLPRVREPDTARWPPTARVMEMATTNGMRILGLGAAPAGIAAGAPADCVLVRRDRTGTLMFPETLDGFVTHAGPASVDAVMIAGRWVLRDDRILTFDEPAMLAAAAAAHAGIAERAAASIPPIHAGLAAIAPQFRSWLAPLA
jgi:cytosine/adenosine deaminase-related metal-dependent hydrolase